ncbi:YoaK family protein [Pedobacter sp. BAL39]|uniref:YoaK family protein n=1 Tax=Pedobacter sp. BAL39 TaxID=391596 RepID=UPI0012FCAF07
MRGKAGTYSHNLRLASILSGVAGLVNISGVLGVGTLTTNVTGHFAYFSEQLFLENYSTSLVYLSYIIFFLLGSFVSGLFVEWGARNKPYNAYIIPILIEIFILISISLSPVQMKNEQLVHLMFIPAGLLFAMGLQNALVTRVSQSVVRTTHLTGLFTDLGIELSQLFFYRDKEDQRTLRRSLFLKLMIIGFFFLGGIIGGICYRHFALKTLLLPGALLLFALWYDRLLFRYYSLKRKFR